MTQTTPYSNTLSALILMVARSLDDCISGLATGGSTTTLVSTLLLKPNDYYNGSQLHIYAGTHLDTSREITDFVNSTNTITFAPAVAASVDTTDYYMVLRKFTYDQYKDAINMAIDKGKDRYLLNKVDVSLAQLADNTLASDFVVGDGHFHVTSDTFPAAPFDVTIDSEIFNVTVKTGTSFKATPAQHITTAANHSSGAAVVLATNLKQDYAVPDGFRFINKIIPENSLYSDTYLESEKLLSTDWGIVKNPTAPKIRFLSAITTGCHWEITGQSYQSQLTVDASVCYMPTSYIVQTAKSILMSNKPEYKDVLNTNLTLAEKELTLLSSCIAPGSRACFEF